MGSSVIRNQINAKLSEITTNDKTLVVLKGIPVSYVDPSIHTMSSSAKNCAIVILNALQIASSVTMLGVLPLR